MRIIINNLSTKNEIVLNEVKWFQMYNNLIMFWNKDNKQDTIKIDKNDFITIE